MGVTRSTTQSPAGYSAQNLAGAQLAARMAATASATQRGNLRTAISDLGYLFKIHPGETAFGLVEANLSFGYLPGVVERYGNNVVPGTTDMSAAFSTMGQVCGKTGIDAEWGLTAPYLLSNPVNWTGIRGVTFTDRSSKNLSVNAPSVIINHAGHGFDIATSTECTFNHVMASNNGATIPNTLFFSARDAGGGGGGIHRFNNCRTAFNAKFKWVYYGYGSEENTFFGCTFYQNQPGSGIIGHVQTNPAAFTSSFVAIAAGLQSNTENHHYGFGYYQLGNSGANNEICFQVENTGNFTVRDGTWANAHGLAYVNVLGNTGSTNLTFDSIRGEPLGGGLQPLYGVYVSNTAGVNFQWKFDNVTADSVNDLLFFATAQTPSIQQLRMIISSSTSGKVLTAYNMSNSCIETIGDSVITGTVGGNCSNNVFIGGRNNITLNGTAAQNCYIDNNLGAHGLDNDSFTSGSAACTGAITTAAVYTARLQPNGKTVTLALPALLGVATAAASFSFGIALPAAMRPAGDLRFPVVIEDNGATPNQLGVVFINHTTGVISVFKDVLNTALFTAAPNAGLPAITNVTWNL